MTVESEVNKSGPYEGDGSNTSFTYSFMLYHKNDVKVIHTDSSGVETPLTVDVDFVVNSVGSATGTIDYPVSGSPLPSGEFITIIRDMTFKQEVDLVNQGGWYPEVVETEFDRIIMICQQLKEVTDRSVKVDASSSTSPDSLLDDVNTAAAAASASASAAATSETNAAASASAAASSAVDAAASADDAAAYAAALDPDSKADKVSGATTDNFAGLDASGNLQDSGVADGDLVHIAGAESITGHKTFKEVSETVYALTGTDISLANGTIQPKTLTANTTLTSSLTTGQSVTLQITAGVYTITWPTIVWVGGSAPVLDTSNTDVIILWHDGTNLNGSHRGVLS